MASFRIKYRKSFEKEIRSIPQEYADRIASHIDSLARNPFPSGSKKLRRDDLYRIRIGDYRVVYSLDTENQIIVIERVSHRKDVY
ncbi:MAG: type II toxin-antitoxin system RelE family toxin [Bacteroidota bacterium]